MLLSSQIQLLSLTTSKLRFYAPQVNPYFRQITMEQRWSNQKSVVGLSIYIYIFLHHLKSSWSDVGQT